MIKHCQLSQDSQNSHIVLKEVTCTVLNKGTELEQFHFYLIKQV